MSLRRLLGVGLGVGLLASLAAFQHTVATAEPSTEITVAAQDDATTLDPHAFNHGMTMTIVHHIYEGLVRRSADGDIEPALAESWTRPEPVIWRFDLRDGVAFHDGTPFSAEDVVFSVKRAMSESSDMKIFTAGIADVAAVDSDTVDITTEFPNAALLQSLTEVLILSSEWAATNGAETPAAFRAGDENFATTNANGTGPFRVVNREPQVRTEFEANADWWDEADHNIAKGTFLRIANDATRVAALLSGEVDFAYPVPLQDVARVNGTDSLSVLTGSEIRVMFLSMDQHRDELAYGSVKDANPFKDQRVRQAVYQAIDSEAIVARIMLGAGAATGGMIAPSVNSVDPSTTARRYAYDPDAATALLADAGYPDGFEVTLDCPNDRYINDERVCQAVASMLAKIGIEISVNALPSARFFQKVGGRDSSFNFFGYTPVNQDAFNTLNVILHSPNGSAGQWNVGNYANAEVDALIEQVLSAPDAEERLALVTEALRLHAEDVGHIPLYQQGLSWGMRDGVTTPLMADNRVMLRHFRVD